MSARTALIAAAAFAVATQGLAAQSLQYRSPRTGAAYVSQPDTGGVARAEAALADHPDSVGFYIRLGLAQSDIRQYREAIATFTRALARWPDDPILYRWRGHRRISVRELDSALADLERGNRLDPANYDIWYHLGVAHYVRGEFDAAAGAFAHARRLAPNANEVAGSADWLWMSLSRAGRPAEARASLASLGDSLPVTSARAYWRRLQLYRGRIGPDQVLTSADTEAITAATLSYGVGNWYLIHADTARARLWFQRAVATGGWPAFGFIAAEAELTRLPAEHRP